MTNLHPLTSQIIDFIGADSAHQSKYYQHIPTNNKFNQIIVEYLEGVYSALLDWQIFFRKEAPGRTMSEEYLQRLVKSKVEEILSLPAPDTLEEELQAVMQKHVIQDKWDFSDLAKTAIAYLREKGLLKK